MSFSHSDYNNISNMPAQYPHHSRTDTLQHAALNRFLRAERTTTVFIVSSKNPYKKPKSFDVSNETSATSIHKILKAFEKGTIVLERDDGSRAITSRGSEMFAHREGLPLIKRRANQSTESGKQSKSKHDNHSTRTSKENQMNKAPPKASNKVEDNPIEHETQERQTLGHYEILDKKITDTFLAEIHQISTDFELEKKESDIKEKIPDSLSLNKFNISTTASRAPTEKNIEDKTHHVKDLRTDKSNEKATDEIAHFDAAKKKDEVAAEKKRGYIKEDVEKATKKQELILNQEINEAALNEMLENGEINEAARVKFINCADINEDFLNDMLKAELINIEVYNKFMNSLYK